MKWALIGAGIAVVLVWLVCVRHRLAAMEENVCNAMRQIGVQLSSRFDALTALLELAQGRAAPEMLLLLESVRSGRSPITAASAPEEVQRQEALISKTLKHVDAMTGQHPELRTEEGYLRCMTALDSYEKMVQTGRLIYNDSVAKLNRELHTFPTRLAAGVLGFHTHEYLELPGMANG